MKFALIAGVAALITAPAMAAEMASPPVCGGKVQDSCVQSKSEARAMTAEQAAQRDAKTGMWTPDGSAMKKMAAPMKKEMMHNDMMMHDDKMPMHDDKMMDKEMPK
jgi:hypothetical protein